MVFKIAILQKRAINAQIDKNVECIITAMQDRIKSTLLCKE